MSPLRPLGTRGEGDEGQPKSARYRPLGRCLPLTPNASGRCAKMDPSTTRRTVQPFYFPLLFLVPGFPDDAVDTGPFQIAKRRWDTSTFDLATLATKHKLHLPYQAMDVFLSRCTWSCAKTNDYFPGGCRHVPVSQAGTLRNGAVAVHRAVRHHLLHKRLLRDQRSGQREPAGGPLSRHGGGSDQRRGNAWRGRWSCRSTPSYSGTT